MTKKTTLWLDLETFSERPIKDGAHRYAEDPTTEVMLFAFAIDDEPPQVWDRTVTTPAPADLVRAITDHTVTVVAHNSSFDRTVLRHNMPQFCPPLPRWRDTMIMAYQHSLPGGLADLCAVLNIPTDSAKDKRGKELVQLFCKPRPKNHRLRRATRETHPKEWAEFVQYAGQDIVAMRACFNKMPRWNQEWDLWHLDQEMNDHGVRIDLDLCAAAITTIYKAQTSLKSRTVEMTTGLLDNTTQRDAVLWYIRAAFGLDLPDLTSETVDKYLGSQQLPYELREILELRRQASTSSTAKYRKILDWTSTDGRARGLLQFCGASRTGRWAGRGPQFHNLPRPTLKGVDDGILSIKAGVADCLFDDPMEVASSAIRGTIVATEGNHLLVSDLSNIEGRVAAWLAGESWKLQAFRDFDAGAGPDLYCLAYARSFRVPPETVDKAQRQIGKVQELALSYGGGANAFAVFAAGYGANLDELADSAWDTLPVDTRKQAEELLVYVRKRQKIEMSDRAWITCDTIKRLWRAAHPAIQRSWNDLQTAVLSALQTPRTEYQVCRCVIDRRGPWLRIRLPSGRVLCYPHIHLHKEKVAYFGVNQYTRRWSRLESYGPKFLENITQAVSRDILALGIQSARDQGMNPVLSIHDEIICDTTQDRTLDELIRCMITNPDWARGIPLAASGFTATRYRKE